MSDTSKRLRASIRFRAFDGDDLERSICAQQMSDAAYELDEHARARVLLEQEIERLREKSEKDDRLIYAETEKTYLAEKEIERLRAEVVDVTRSFGRTRLRIVRALEQIRHKPGADNETAYEMRKIASEALGHE